MCVLYWGAPRSLSLSLSLSLSELYFRFHYMAPGISERIVRPRATQVVLCLVMCVCVLFVGKAKVGVTPERERERPAHKPRPLLYTDTESGYLYIWPHINFKLELRRLTHTLQAAPPSPKKAISKIFGYS